MNIIGLRRSGYTTLQVKPQMVTVVIDCRERALLEILGERSLSFTYESQQLDVGDVHVLIDGEMICCMERKTYADLLSSIGDGRFREQRDRMKCTIGPKRMAYVLEGFPDRHTLWDASCITATLHLQHRDGIRIVHTHDTRDTAHYIELLVARIAKEPEKYIIPASTTTDENASASAAGASAYQSNLHAAQVCRKKGGNLNSAAVYRLMLSSIPGISERIAANIEAKMGSFKTLMATLTACSTHSDRMAALTNIDKVGSGKATQILESLGFL